MEPIKRTKSRPIFPVLYDYVVSYGGVYKFCRDCEMHPEVFYRMMYETGNPKLSTIRAVLEQTGMTFEEAFDEG